MAGGDDLGSGILYLNPSCFLMRAGLVEMERVDLSPDTQVILYRPQYQMQKILEIKRRSC